MSHFLADHQAAFKDAAARFARKEIEAVAVQIDREEKCPPELSAKVAEAGFFGLVIPEQYGGSGADMTTACLVLEELAKASPAFAGLVSVEMILCPEIILATGNDEQKRRLLPKSASGERLLAYSQTEPAGAANLDSHQTRLTAVGDSYRLNGAKLFCTQGEAKTFLVMCRTQSNGKKGNGLVAIDIEQQGFTISPHEHKLGWRGTNTGSISFDDVVVEPRNIIGNILTAPQDIFLVANQSSYLGHAATSLGCAVGMFDKTLQYVRERTLYGQPMYRLSPWADRMARCWCQIEAMRSTLYTATRLFDEGHRTSFLGSAAKVWLCETAHQVCDTLLQAWGGSGIMDSTGVNRYVRDARTNLVAEGTTEMHTAFIAENVLGFRNQDTVYSFGN